MTLAELLHHLDLSGMVAAPAMVCVAIAAVFNIYRLLRRDQGDRDLFRHAFDETGDVHVLDLYADVACARRKERASVPTLRGVRLGGKEVRPPPEGNGSTAP